MSNWIGLTGAGGGIGQALIEECLLTFPNKKIIGMDISESQLKLLEEKHAGKFMGVVQDVTEKQSFLQSLETLYQNYGTPDLWFNNAGIAMNGPFLEVGLDKFEKVMQVNFTSLVWATHFWLEKFSGEEGCLIQIASMAGKIPSPLMASYAASKFAVVGFTKSLQQELEILKSRSRLLLVTPGFVETNIVQLGQKNGMPEEMSFLLGAPESCAQEIIRAIKNKSLEVSPSFTGKLLEIGNKLSPAILRQLAVHAGKKMLNKS